jgi:hypothetical protein
MGEMHKKSLEGFKLDPQLTGLIVILAIFFPGWSTIIAGFLCKDEAKKSEIIKVGLCQWLTCCICVGWCWSIKWAMEAKAQSA